MRRLLAIVCVPLSATCLAACASTTSTSSFKGTEHDVAQTVANLQSHVTASEQKKVCGEDLDAHLVASLGGAKQCEAAVKEQLADVDNTELEVESVKVSGDTATAVVKSTYGGKKALRTLSFVKEAGKWKIGALSSSAPSQ
jgi:copper chaperone CopZ